MKNLAINHGAEPTPFVIHRSERSLTGKYHPFQNAILFEAFMKHAPMVAWITDEDGYMHYMNPRYLSIYGLNDHDIGKNISEIFPEAIAREYLCNNRMVIDADKAIEITENGITAKGEMQTLRIFKFPIKTANKRMVAGWALDITEQVKLETELSKNIERYYLLNKATSSAIYDWDVSKKIIYRGQGFQTLFGYDSQSGSIRFKLHFIHPDDLQSVKDIVFTSLRDERTDRWQVEYRYKDAHGRYRNVMDKAFIVRHEGKAVRVIGAMEDITRQKELQEALIKQEQMNKQEMVRSIIETQEKERRQLSVELHDNVNQILSSCKLMLEVAQSNPALSSMMVAKAYESMQKVITEIRHISHHLNPSALLDIGLTDAIQQMVDDINCSGTIRISFLHEGDFSDPYLNEQDRISIFRIVQEKLTNILKHSQARNAWINLCIKDGQLTMLMEDNGIGFDPQKVKKGIGLRNIQNRVDYYGGKLNFTSVPGKGSRMEIEIVFGPGCVKE